MIVGAITGLGAVLFFYLLEQSTHFFIYYLANYHVPPPGPGASLPDFSEVRWALIPLITGLGGLLSGLIVYKWAPEAEGHGTDAVIEAFHKAGGFIRGRVPIVKMIASTLTIGTGGSAGREGPVVQIGAGFGSLLATKLKLNEHDRRILLIAGAAAGIGSIFKAPLGGALFAVEVLYKRDVEAEALAPALVASIVGYSIFSSIYGFGRIFSTPHYSFTNPASLVFYALLGLVSAPVAILYIKTFYGTRDLFKRLKLPNHFKPAVGGLLMGLLALLVPQSLSTGYGWIQLIINGKLALTTLAVLLVAKILATSLTIGSGGSGGVFAPSLVIGATLGSLLGTAFNLLFPNIVTDPSAFVVVGMAAFFAGAAGVPITSMIIVAEMTGSYNLLIPAMLSCAISYVLVWRWSIYEKQVPTRADSPAHLGDFNVEVLRDLMAKDVMKRKLVTVSPDMSAKDVAMLITRTRHMGFPVVDKGRLVGIIVYSDLLKIRPEDADKVKVRDLMSKRLVVGYPYESLEVLLRRLYNHNVSRIPIVDPEDPTKLLGLITKSDIVRSHEEVRHGEFVEEIEFFKSTKVGDLMRRHIVVVCPEADVKEAAKLMASHDLPICPVVEGDKLVGVVTYREILNCFLTGECGPVSEIMSKKFRVISPDENLAEAMRLMAEGKTESLVVVRKGQEKPVGILLERDIFRAYWLEYSALHG